MPEELFLELRDEDEDLEVRVEVLVRVGGGVYGADDDPEDDPDESLPKTFDATYPAAIARPPMRRRDMVQFLSLLSVMSILTSYIRKPQEDFPLSGEL